ncbi:MAG TPA: glycosyltransferase [Candidatus Limnocylindrales bacterium]|nr:glycosyltransferase [Candidatus Limnocylindrales bacterium]
MRILNVTQSYVPFFEFGGPPAKVKALAEGLAGRGHEVTVLTADWGLERRLAHSPNEPPSEPSPFGRWREVNGVTAIYLPNRLHYRALSWNSMLGQYLRAQLDAFDVVHIFGLYDLLGPRVGAECRTRKIPYVVEPIGMFVPIVRSIWLKRMYHEIWGRRLCALADAVIATAEQERDDLLAGGIAGEKIRLRRNGVEIPANFPKRGKFRRDLKIPETAKLILFLGRFSRKKSPDLLLMAFAGIGTPKNAAGIETHLAFVGPDESGMKARLLQTARQFGVSDRVHFSPALGGEAKWSAYRDADIFVLPSQNENFGNTAAEAVAAGTPVIVTDRCGIAPLLKDVAGLVIRHEEEDLRHALVRLLDDGELRDRLRKGCADAAAKLGWDQPVQEMEAIYSGLARHV